MMKAVAVVLALALCVAHVQAGPLSTRPSSAGFGRQLLDSLAAGRHLLERRMGRAGRSRGGSGWGGDSWGGSSWSARDRAYSAAMRNTDAAIEAAAHGAISPRDATDYAAYQRRCAANMDWDCLGRHHRKMLRAK